jgi:hypothetical protein
MTNIGTTYINKLSNWWPYVEDSMLIWSLIQYVDDIITICIELTLGLFWHNLHSFNMHSMDKILSILRQDKLISYWIDVVTTFIKMDFQCCCISHKINTSLVDVLGGCRKLHLTWRSMSRLMDVPGARLHLTWHSASP